MESDYHLKHRDEANARQDQWRIKEPRTKKADEGGVADEVPRRKCLYS